MAYLNETGLARLWNHIISKLNEKATQSDIDTAVANLVNSDDLNVAIENALTQAKNSGEFDGEDGTSVTVASVSESTEDGGSNVVTFSDGKTLTVKNGNAGATGFSPTITTSKTGKTTTITLTDVNGTETATILDGEDCDSSLYMPIATYDSNGDGIVDNAEKLGGKLPSAYALASDLFSGSYLDLTDKPTIPSISGLATETYVDENNALKVSKTGDTMSGSLIIDKDNSTPYLRVIESVSNSTSSYVGQLYFDGTAFVVGRGAITKASGEYTETTAITLAYANATVSKNNTAACLRNIQYSTTDLTAGTSSLATGQIYLVYE